MMWSSIVDRSWMLQLFEVGRLRSRSIINVFSTGVVSLMLYRRFVVLIQSLVTYRYCSRFEDSVVVVMNITIEFYFLKCCFNGVTS